jgi:hypothetical protein
MKQGETAELEIQVLDDGLIRARRKDRRPLTEGERLEVIKWVDSQPGITAADVLRVFPGAKVVQSR